MASKDVKNGVPSDGEEALSFIPDTTAMTSPSSHHRFFNVKTYTLLISLIYACCAAGTAIIIGTVTTLQKAFGFSSTQVRRLCECGQV